MISLFESTTSTQKAQIQLRSIIEHVADWDDAFLQVYADTAVTESGFSPGLSGKVFELPNEDGDLAKVRPVSGKPVWTLLEANAFPGQQVQNLPNSFEQRLLIEKPETVSQFSSLWNRLREPVFIYVADQVHEDAMMMAGAKGHEFLVLQSWQPLKLVQDKSQDAGILELAADVQLWPLNERDREKALEKLDVTDLSHALSFQDRFVGFVPGFEEDMLFEERIFHVFIPVSVEEIEIDGQKALIKSLDSEWERGDFSYSFRELNEITKNAKEIGFKDLEVMIGNLLNQGAEKFEAFGLKISGAIVAMVGLPLLTSIQLYFLLHYRAYMALRPTFDKIEPFPWIGVYRQKLPRLVFLLTSTVLPVITQIVLIYDAFLLPPQNTFWWIPAGLAGLISLIVSVATAYDAVKR